ncbi:MAG: hypothetical protein WCD11_35340 [Solirubrobacteraceae bacterium]
MIARPPFNAHASWDSSRPDARKHRGHSPSSGVHIITELTGILEDRAALFGVLAEI